MVLVLICAGIWTLFNSKTTEGVAADVAYAVIEALRLLGRHLCAQDLFEEMLCAACRRADTLL
jgi:multidrug transporter EmrE-like cation transporter